MMSQLTTTLLPSRRGFRRDELPARADRRRADRVHDAYCAHAERFTEWTPSAPFRAVFDSAVLTEIRRRTTHGRMVHVLEVGCGHGTWAEEIFSGIDGADDRIHYQGIDFAEPRIAAARLRMARHPAARFDVADADEYDGPAQYDLILAIEVLSHLSRKHYQVWLRRWMDWLRPGGAFVVIDKDCYTGHAMRLKWDAIKRRVIPRVLRGRPYYFEEDFGDLLETLRYPSFRHIAGYARRLGYRPRPLLSHGAFRAVIGDWPGF